MDLFNYFWSRIDHQIRDLCFFFCSLAKTKTQKRLSFKKNVLQMHAGRVLSAITFTSSSHSKPWPSFQFLFLQVDQDSSSTRMVFFQGLAHTSLHSRAHNAAYKMRLLTGSHDNTCGIQSFICHHMLRDAVTNQPIGNQQPCWNHMMTPRYAECHTHEKRSTKRDSTVLMYQVCVCEANNCVTYFRFLSFLAVCCLSTMMTYSEGRSRG